MTSKMMKFNHVITLGSFAVLLLASPGSFGAGKTAPQEPAATKPGVSVSQPGHKDAVPPLQKPLIVVDGAALTTQDYINFLQANPSVMSRAGSTESGKADALRELVRLYLIRKALYREGLLPKDEKEPSPKDVAAAYEKLAKQHFPVPPKADEKTSFAYYEAHSKNYGIPATVRLNQMLFKYPANPEPALLNAAKERANVAMKRLAAGENFSAIASELTENPVGKLTAGDIGFVQTGDQPWMVEALKDLKVGEHTGLIESPEGIQILELTDNRPAIIAPYANVRDKVIKDIQDEAQRKVRNEYVFETLGKGVKIEVVEESLKPLFPNGVLP